MCIFQREQVIKLMNDLVSLKKTNGHRIRQFKIHCVARRWDAFRNSRQNRPTLNSWTCYRYEMICHRNSLLRQFCHFDKDLIFVCCCSWWTVWARHSVQIPRGQLTIISTRTFPLSTMHIVQSFSLLLNIQDATACSLENVNFKT